MDLDVIPTGKTTATVILTQDQVDTLRGTPGRSRVPLAITYGAQTYRTSISVYRGEWMMVVNADMRDGGLVPGGTYTAEVAMDTEERTVDVPPDLATAMEAAGARDRWEALSYTARKEHARQVTTAKKPETRERRIAGIVAGLAGSTGST